MAGWIAAGATVIIAFVAVVSALRLQTRERVQDTRTRILGQARFLHTLGVSHIQKVGNPYFPRPMLATIRKHRWSITAILSDSKEVRDVTFLHSRQSSKSEAIENVLQGIYTEATLDDIEKKLRDNDTSPESRIHYEIYGLSVTVFAKNLKFVRLNFGFARLILKYGSRIINSPRRIFDGKK